MSSEAAASVRGTRTRFFPQPTEWMDPDIWILLAPWPTMVGRREEDGEGGEEEEEVGDREEEVEEDEHEE